MKSLKWYISKLLSGILCSKFKNVKYFCIFLGYSRSGHSLIGSLLDAHRNICISHELNVLNLVMQEYSYSQLRYLIAYNSTLLAKKGRIWDGYDYTVKGQYQGKLEDIYVLGDKKGGTSTILLNKHPYLLDQLQKKLPIPIKVLHVIRNPFDCIATHYIKNKQNLSLEYLGDQFFNQAKCILNIKSKEKFDIMDIYYENFILYPKNNFLKILSFLDMPNYLGYIDSCRKILFSKVKKSRYDIIWPKEMIKYSEKRIKEFDFLNHYTFNS